MLPEREREGERGSEGEEHTMMDDGPVIAFTFSRESLETEKCTEREIKPHNEGVMTLVINADALGEQECLEEGAPRGGIRGWGSMERRRTHRGRSSTEEENGKYGKARRNKHRGNNEER